MFLRSGERFCVAASARFLRNRGHEGLLYLPGAEGGITALLLLSHRALFPVFTAGKAAPPPRLFRRLIGRIPVHAIQGLRGDVEVMEALLAPLGCPMTDRIDYDLMTLESGTAPAALKEPPRGLVFFKPDLMDMEELYYLQAAYEQEEVLPRGAVFDPVSCRLSLGNLISREHILAAKLDGRIVGKINTSAASFTRYQIGGVYVHPHYRGLGIASRMTAAFLRELAPQGRGFSLFVKKNNPAARRVYRRVGFEPLGDYRICYY
jgi:ribosomal protein S18 acetylase RimI-like enzyme